VEVCRGHATHDPGPMPPGPTTRPTPSMIHHVMVGTQILAHLPHSLRRTTKHSTWRLASVMHRRRTRLREDDFKDRDAENMTASLDPAALPSGQIAMPL
jgi:hypothetical protein